MASASGLGPAIAEFVQPFRKNSFSCGQPSRVEVFEMMREVVKDARAASAASVVLPGEANQSAKLIRTSRRRSRLPTADALALARSVRSLTGAAVLAAGGVPAGSAPRSKHVWEGVFGFWHQGSKFVNSTVLHVS